MIYKFSTLLFCLLNMPGMSLKSPQRDSNMPMDSFWDDLPLVGNNLSRCFKVWDTELESYDDREYILNGIRYGFDILGNNRPKYSIFCDNYKSASVKNKEKATAQIKKELDLGNYVQVAVPPNIEGSIGAIPKGNTTKIQLIHDMLKSGLNESMTDRSVTYTSVDKVRKTMTPGTFCSKIDLEAAFRNVPIAPKC